MGLKKILIITFVIVFIIAACCTLCSFYKDNEDDGFSEFYD